MTQTHEDVKDEALRLINAANEEHIFLRLIGGLAVVLHSPSASNGPLSRKYADADFVTDREGSIRLTDYMERMGYVPNKTFNTLSGDRRQLYYDLERDRQIDIFIGNFSMCHKIPLETRLSRDDPTIPLAELFLTKAQIVEINRKDLIDLMALTLDHDVAPSDEDTINSDVIAELCSKDWGLYTTIILSMDRVLELLPSVGLEDRDARLIRRRLWLLRDAMEKAPKSTGWKLRSKLGTRIRWYDLPEEVQRT